MKEGQAWQSQIDAEAKRKIQAEKTRIENSRFQTLPEALERNRQGELSKKRVTETLQGMLIFNTDIVPVLSSFNQEVWDNLGTISISAEKPKSITLIHASTAYSGEYEKVARGRFGKHTRSYMTGGSRDSGGGYSWSEEVFGSYREVGHRLTKINPQEVANSISVMLGYSDMTGLFELRIADSAVDIEPDGFIEFPDKRRIFKPGVYCSVVTDQKTGIIMYEENNRGWGARIYDHYDQLYRDPSVIVNDPRGEKTKKVPFKNYTIVSSEKGIALFFSKDAVDRDKILNFLNRALVVAGTNRKINKRLPQDIDRKSREELKDLQSRLGKKDFSAPRIEWR